VLNSPPQHDLSRSAVESSGGFNDCRMTHSLPLSQRGVRHNGDASLLTVLDHISVLQEGVQLDLIACRGGQLVCVQLFKVIHVVVGNPNVPSGAFFLQGNEGTVCIESLSNNGCMQQQ